MEHSFGILIIEKEICFRFSFWAIIKQIENLKYYTKNRTYQIFLKFKKIYTSILNIHFMVTINI